MEDGYDNSDNKKLEEEEEDDGVDDLRAKKRSVPGAQARSPGLCRPLTGSSFLSCALLTTRGYERMQETLSVAKKDWLPGRLRRRW